MTDETRLRRQSRATQITERDRLLLAYVAEHRLVLTDHIAALLGISAPAAQARLRSLAKAGLVRTRALFHRQPACHQITRQGLALVGADLPPPRMDVRSYDHDVGVAWLWLVATRGTFGPPREVISERSLRSRDSGIGGAAVASAPAGSVAPAAPSTSREGPLAVRLGGYGPGGRERLHYPDLLLVTDSGKRIAFELELSHKGRGRRERILAGYGADPRIDAVVYLVEDRALGHSIAASARRLGISEIVHVQMVRLASPLRPDGGGRARARARARVGSAERPGGTGAGGPDRDRGSELGR